MDPAWHLLDIFLLNKIFQHLSFSDRYSAGLVCRSWNESFKSPKVWRQLIFNDQSFCNGYGTLNYDRSKAYISQFGHHIQTIWIKTNRHFNALYQFLVLLQWFTDSTLYACNVNHRPLIRLQRFILHFPRSTSTHACTNADGVKLFGIGGSIVTALIKLLSSSHSLTELILADLAVERYEANRMLDHLSVALSQRLKRLSLINLTNNHCFFTQIAMFSNLQILKISPQQIDNVVISSISSYTQLKHLVIEQNKHTPQTIVSCDALSWISFPRWIRLHLHTDELNYDLLLQSRAPFYSVIRQNIQRRHTQQIVQNYYRTLSVYATSGSSIIESCDSDSIYMVQRCNLRVLMICEPITTTALLLITQMQNSLQKLYVRKSMLIVKSLESNRFYEICHQLQLNPNSIHSIAQSITATIQEVKNQLPKSYFLDDFQFNHIQLNVQFE